MLVGGVGGQAVAVVGAGCRLPGGITDPDGLWAALEAGRDLGVGGVGGQGAAGFDAGYFGTRAGEAAAGDPRHRLLLEMAVEALDDAGLDPARLAGSDTGVYTGGAPHDPLTRLFGLRGPGASVDPGPASSLAALARACDALARGDSRVTLAGGATCPDVGAEGGAMLVLKRLGDALADRDRIHGVIAAWGRVPEVYERARVDPDDLVYVEALGGPGDWRDLGHGLGARRETPLPVQAQLRPLETASGVAAVLKALLVLRHRRIPAPPAADPRTPRTGSSCLCAEPSGPGTGRAALPPGPAASAEPGVATASGRCVPSAGLPDAPVSPVGGERSRGETPECVGCSRGETPECVGCSRGEGAEGGAGLVALTGALPAAKGFAGVNCGDAHVIVAPAPADLGRPVRQRGPLPVVVSARSEEALAEAARRMADRLAEAAPEEFYDLAYTACARRGRHPYRKVVLAEGPREAAEALVRGGRRGAVDGRVAFVYCGDGGEWPGMGADLLADRAFRKAVGRVDEALAPYPGGGTVAGRLEAGERGEGRALLFAVQVGVTEMLAARGIRAVAAVGHGVGELTAAWAAGDLPLEEAARRAAEPPSPAAGPEGASGEGRGSALAGVELLAHIGPPPMPVTLIRQSGSPAIVATMDPGRDGVEVVDRAVDELVVAGADTDWSAYFTRPGRVVTLPAYPWQRDCGLPARRMLHNVSGQALYVGGVS
ncbi:beta-ketoacyl synthase N-terminal-like domain-containing protein [Nonomuraea sp. ATR24]|uniref:beta-ketoacyl synthase N-terminal-like domain-containing protein n=1 Tax=Nonomuraea sp. ATR24 TaxID=1676744 RepID=UPI0035C1E6AA